jgi:putative ABC transport system permease protein
MTRVALRGLIARPLRTFLTAFAIVLGVGMVAAAFTFTDTTRKAADALSSDSYNGTDAVVSAKTAFAVGTNDWTVVKPEIPAAAVEKVRQVPGVAVAIGDVTDVNTKLIGKDGKPIGTGPYFGIGFDSKVAGADRLTPFRLDSGRWAAGPGEVVIDASTSEKQHYGVGDRIRVSAKGTSTYQIVGVARFASVKSLGTATVAVFDLATAQKATGMSEKYDSILVAAGKGVPAAGLRASLSKALGSSVVVETASAQDRFGFDGLKQFIDIIRIVLLVFGGVAIVVGAFTIFNSLSITVAQRTRELGQLRMIGASRRQVLAAVVIEALLLGLIASAVGVVFGLGLAIGLSALFASLGLDLPTTSTVFGLRTIGIAGGIGVGITVFAGLIPAWKATRVAPIAALSGPGDAMGKVSLPGRAIQAITGIIGAPVAKAGGSAGVLARRNSMRHPGRTAATAAALMIGVSLMTAVAVVGSGLKDSTKGSLDRRISADYVVTAQDGYSPIDQGVLDDVGAVPGVKAVASVRQDGGQVLGQVEVVNGLDPTAAQTLRFDWAKGDDSVPAKLDGDGAIVDEGWATEHKKTVGDSFELTSAKGRTLHLTIRGIERSPVLDAMGLGPITMSTDAFETAFDAQQPAVSYVSAPESSKAGIDRALTAHPESMVQTKSAFIDDRTSDIDILLGIFAVLLALAVVVSLFGIVNTLVLATFERTRELGVLRAVGMSRRQMRRMVRGESIITALMGAVAGMALGLGLAYIATSALHDEGLTFVLPVTTLVALTIVAVIAGVLAAVLPARRAARLDVLTALAYE